MTFVESSAKAGWLLLKALRMQDISRYIQVELDMARYSKVQPGTARFSHCDICGATCISDAVFLSAWPEDSLHLFPHQICSCLILLLSTGLICLACGLLSSVSPVSSTSPVKPYSCPRQPHISLFTHIGCLFIGICSARSNHHR